MKHTASAAWTGTLKTGAGTLATQSGALKQAPYTYGMRFAADPGTNPEELIAAAHAACFSMALAARLEKEKMPAKSIHVWAAVTLDKVDQGFAITAVHLDLAADIPGANESRFVEVAEQAKAECPVGKLFKVAATLTAKLAA